MMMAMGKPTPNNRVFEPGAHLPLGLYALCFMALGIDGKRVLVTAFLSLIPIWWYLPCKALRSAFRSLKVELTKIRNVREVVVIDYLFIAFPRFGNQPSIPFDGEGIEPDGSAT